jgi:two-component system, cell cycle sensor histidine kinase and response regulator CckA
LRKAAAPFEAARRQTSSAVAIILLQKRRPTYSRRHYPGCAARGIRCTGHELIMKILLVEDHQESRHNLQRLIERRGHEVHAVASAEEAKRALQGQSFPFLILDWMLPGQSGIEFCRELRAQLNGDEMFILLVTARADTEDLEQALAAGASDYLTKPLDIALLNVRLSVAERQIRDLAERNHARTALQESARTVTNILENTTDGFFSLNEQWNFTYLNPEAERLLARKRHELLGKELWAEFPELLGSRFETNYRLVLSEQQPVEFEASDRAGKIWFEMHAYPSGSGISVFFRDVTERKRTEEERLTTSKLDSLGTMAGGIAHDLNNILTVISGNIGLAQIEAPTDAGSLLSFLSKAGQAAQHAAHLSSQLLTFSKGGAPLKRVASVSDLLAQAAEFSLYGSNLRADVDLAADLWNAEVDPGQIEQVVNALVINAREAMPHGGTVRVSARNVTLEEEGSTSLPAGRYIKVTIADRGSGIADDITTKIFDPYFTTKPLGSGLGLAISYSIIKRHGGLLYLEASSPEGAAFAFYLPATIAEANGREARPPERVFNFNHQRILVMDDEAAIRDLTSQLLSTLGYEVTAVPDGLEAVRMYERALRRGEHFQAVILDATIRGGMGGLATIERLRTVDPNVTAIICSGYSDEAALSQFLAYGFRSALPKPFSRRELSDALQRAFETSKKN